MDTLFQLDPTLLNTLQTGWYIVMFGLMFLEGPFVTIASAFLASLGFFNIYVVALLWWAWDFIGDLAFFFIGKYGLRMFLKKTTIDTPEEHSFIEKIHTLMKENLLLTVIISKLTPYAPLFTFPYMGKMGISLRKFALASALTSIPIPITVALVGYHIHTIQYIFSTHLKQEIFIALLLLWGGTMCIMAIAWYLWKRYMPTIKTYQRTLPRTRRLVKKSSTK